MKELSQELAQKIMDRIKEEKNQIVISVSKASFEFLSERELLSQVVTGKNVYIAKVISPISDNTFDMTMGFNPNDSDEEIIVQCLDCIPEKSEMLGQDITNIIGEAFSGLAADDELNKIMEMHNQLMKDVEEAKRKKELFESYKEKMEEEHDPRYFILKMIEREAMAGNIDLEEFEKRILELDSSFVL